jgi:hypothetical protein
MRTFYFWKAIINLTCWEAAECDLLIDWLYNFCSETLRAVITSEPLQSGPVTDDVTETIQTSSDEL